MDEIFIQLFHWFWSWERRFEPVWRTKWQRPPARRHLLKCAFKFFLVTQGSCFCLKTRLPASSDDDNVFLNAARVRLQRGKWKNNGYWVDFGLLAGECFHFCLRFCLIFKRWSHIWLHFQHQRLASNMSLTMDKIPQFGSMSIMKVSSARSNQWWFLTCPTGIAHANRLMDAACRPSCPVYQHLCFHTRLLSNHCREPRWKWL